MRVKLGNDIYFCTNATISGIFIFLYMPEGIFSVNLITTYDVTIAYKDLLEKGYYDFTKYDYAKLRIPE